MTRGTGDAAAMRWVIFDLGGVVVPDPGPVLARAMGEMLGIAPEACIRRAERFERDLTTGRMSLLDVYGMVLRELSPRVAPAAALARHLEVCRAILMERDPAVLRLIARLKGACGVACLTNTEREVARLSHETGLFDLFDRAFASTELGLQKPDEEIFVRVLAELACPPAAAVFVDDKAPNVEAARRVGIHAILFRGAERLERELHGACPGPPSSR